MEEENLRYLTENEKEAAGALQPRWVTAKLILGIISMALFAIVVFQSCAAGLGDALKGGGTSGAAGFMVALNLLISGIIAVAARKSVKLLPWLICTILLWLNYFYAKIMRGDFSDLLVWGFVSFAFGVVYLLSAMRTKKSTIIAAAVSAVYLLVALL